MQNSQVLAPGPIKGIGVGLRAQHFSYILQQRPLISWFEALTDNYLNEGGPALDYLMQIRQHYPMVLHGVGLSLGSTDPLDKEYLKKLKSLAHQIQPTFISEHLSWISVKQQYLHQLLPLPYTREAVDHVVNRIKQVQDFLEQPILIENVSSYLQYSCSELTEWEFLMEIAEQANCFILLDINNIYVSAKNQNFSAEIYLNSISPSRVKQLHLAGYSEQDNYLLDDHGSPVTDTVWDLYAKALSRFGAVPTLIEWDANIPEFSILQEQAVKAQDKMQKLSNKKQLAMS